MKGESCDLVTCAQAIHWLDAKAFYTEAKRILKSNGLLAVYGYSIPFFPDNEEATTVVSTFHNDTLKGYWNDNRRHIVNGYAEFHLPFPITERMVIQQDWPVPLSHFVKYIETWSAYITYRKMNPLGPPILEQMHISLRESFNQESDDPVINCAFRVFLLLGLQTNNSLN